MGQTAQHTGLAFLLLALMLLTGCATRSGGSSSERDGPERNPPPHLGSVPDAVPRLDPVRVGGPNKPYEVLGERYEPLKGDVAYAEKGLASWYGKKFHGRPTASGEVYNMYAMTAAHATLPIPSYARVRNPSNGREVIVRINDRGPFHKGRIIDLSYTAALRLDVLHGVTSVEVRRITHAEIRAGNWVKPAGEPVPVFVPDAPPGGPLRETTSPAMAAGDGVYWLQFGTFARLDGAEGLRQRVAEADLSLLPLLTIVREAGRHHLRAGPFPSLDEARATAARLRNAGGIDASLVEKR
ncbi:septal ring lytic transglycosylase RlpA family protein [Roseateles sp.]|uniref:septal ring lytic transglycosylase RlpA family protein n=1 Tax=Roseateles sp. TaxID=1971397 RepID=UPI0025CC5C07|nr:septal ring lytic transglycosylase RlpA family protein [Roseateles sp.]